MKQRARDLDLILFRQAEGKEDWLVVIAAGPNHEGVPSPEAA